MKLRELAIFPIRKYRLLHIQFLYQRHRAVVLFCYVMSSKENSQESDRNLILKSNKTSPLNRSILFQLYIMKA